MYVATVKFIARDLDVRTSNILKLYLNCLQITAKWSNQPFSVSSVGYNLLSSTCIHCKGNYKQLKFVNCKTSLSIYTNCG